MLAGTPGTWDARGARLTARLPGGHVAYDGRATAEENWYERTGLARRDGDGYAALPGDPIDDVRYLDVVALPGGGAPDLLRVPAARRRARAADRAHRVAAAGAAVISGTPNASTSSPASGRSSAQSAFTVRITAFERAAVRRPCSW